MFSYLWFWHYSFSIREIINYTHASGATAQRNKVNWICNQAVWIMRLNDSQMKDWKWFDIWFGHYISTTGQTPIQLTPAWFEREVHVGGVKEKRGKSSRLQLQKGVPRAPRLLAHFNFTLNWTSKRCLISAYQRQPAALRYAHLSRFVCLPLQHQAWQSSYHSSPLALVQEKS